MCGRYTLAAPDPARLRERFPLGESVEVRRRFNVAPGDDVLAVAAGRDGAPRGTLLRWGLVPSWAEDPRTGFKMINARAETVAEKPAFRDAFAHRRCLVIADGFYEWQREGGRKRPFHITRADGAPFAFAGLWATWHGPDGLVLRTCTIVTTEAAPSITRLHDRMPVILEPGEEATWLDPAAPPAVLRALLDPLADDRVAFREVSPAVNDARFDDPHCLDPWSGGPDSEPAAQPSLF